MCYSVDLFGATYYVDTTTILDLYLKTKFHYQLTPKVHPFICKQMNVMKLVI
jgi:hypothetical protein